jgi:hypothetical protein
MSEQIDQFFRPDGTLISIPAKATKYPEKELNAIIANFHDDTAAIRRYMIEYGILERDRGSVYWVSVKV